MFNPARVLKAIFDQHGPLLIGGDGKSMNTVRLAAIDRVQRRIDKGAYQSIYVTVLPKAHAE
uniref:Uncharacterized protein n=1 Tax=Pseudomonas phage RVTF4 TaxID=3236931 RepID=A0AB39CD11_9VIRU